MQKKKTFFKNKEKILWVNKKLPKQNSPLRVGSLFSGIGAFEQALKILNIKYKTVFASDNDPFVKQSYFANYNINENQWFDDVEKINGPKFKGKIDLLVGGAPCQSFSMIGKRKGLNDDRGNLTLHFIKKVNQIKPEIFIFENVKAIMNVDSGLVWKTLTALFKKTGYSIHYDLLNAKNYGIPQNRERLFLIGFKNHNEFQFPKEIKLKKTMQDLLEDSYDETFNLPPKGIAFVTKEKNIKKRYTQIDGKIALCQKRNQQFNWHGDFVKIKNEELKKYILSEKVKQYVLSSGTKNFYSKPEIDLKIARPLVSTMHKMHRSGVDNYISVNKEKIRKLTPKECLRLMGFPDHFKQVVSNTQMYRQAGNSIVVNKIIALYKAMEITKFTKKIDE